MQDHAGIAFARGAGRLWMAGWLAAAALVCASPAPAQIEFHPAPGHIGIAIDGKPFTDFYIGSEYPKPFLHPLRAADGRVVTRQFPMSQVEGETQDHPHHRGLFIGYGSISGINFWENEQAYTTPNRGRIVLIGRAQLDQKEDNGAIRAEFSWRDPAGKEMLTESRLMEFRGGATSRTIDFTLELTAKRDLHFDDTKEGFFAIRVADSMRETAGGQLLNSHGDRGEKQIWGKRADWAEYSGNVDGKPVAILIFDHPSNFNHPPRWHARAYGLFAVNPFGLKDFEPTSTEAGGASVKSGEKLRFRYRVLISDAPLTISEAERVYKEFASSRPQ
jgi:Methane oxygenase PmoA